MTRNPVVVPDHMTVGELCDLFQVKNINGAPVVDRAGRLVGVVAQDDIIYGAMGHPDRAENGRPADAGPASGADPGGRRRRNVVAILRERRLKALPDLPPRPGEPPFWAEDRKAADPLRMPVSAIMTSPPISAEEGTPVAELCRVMWNLKIHRVPIVRGGRVTGLVSSMDLCRAILSGLIKV
jgi:CBS-domain-containing membrane protein